MEGDHLLFLIYFHIICVSLPCAIGDLQICNLPLTICDSRFAIGDWRLAIDGWGLRIGD